MDIFYGIDATRLKEIINRIKKVKIALIGDICLDVYWKADMTKSELSRETPHYPLPVVEERMSPGGGGNAAANIAALLPESVHLMGITGRDWRGIELARKLKEAGIVTDSIIVSGKAVTNAYCKPILKGISNLEYEAPRLDFCNYQELLREDETALLEQLIRLAGEIDVLCVSDQLAFGCITPAVRAGINKLAREGLKVVVDSRDRIGLYQGATLKPNEVEGMRAVHKAISTAGASLEEYASAAGTLALKNSSDVCMTLGPKGCIYTDSKTNIHIPSYKVPNPIDICGAGDTFLAAFSCATAAGAAPYEAASFANLAADVTIKKIGVTGTASPEEIIERHTQVMESKTNKNFGI